MQGEIKMNAKLNQINPDVAGIDIGSESHYVSVPEGRSDKSVKVFGCFTPDLYNLANWLLECNVKSVAMESTGVYWIPLYEILDARGFEVILVNARDVKNVPGRKTDVQDCQWLQQLHSYGLLRASFRPDDHICVLRGFMRQRDNLVRGSAIHVQRMQKALTQMNIQLHKVISDITGQTGMKIITAILSGQRDPKVLAKLRGPRIKNSEEIIAKALEGNYREEHLFSLEQEFALYNTYIEKIEQCDKRIYAYCKTLESKDVSNDTNGQDSNGKPTTLTKELIRMSGVDFTKIPGIEMQVLQVILSEVGLNANKWKTDKHFTSWLGLTPANKITGGKIFSTRTRKVNNRAAAAFRMAAWNVGKSKNSALGAFYRRLKTRMGSPKAITATARKLASLFYNMLKYGQEYVEKGIDYYDKKYQDKVVRGLNKKAEAFGYALVKVTGTQ